MEGSQEMNEESVDYNEEILTETQEISEVVD